MRHFGIENALKLKQDMSIHSKIIFCTVNIASKLKDNNSPLLQAHTIEHRCAVELHGFPSKLKRIP